MASFCKYCGTALESGELCNCEKAVEARAKDQVEVDPTPIIQENLNAATQPVAPPQVPQNPQIQPHSPEIQMPEPVTKAVNQTSSFLSSFLKNPVKTAENAEGVPSTTAGILLGLQIISFIIFWIAFVARIMKFDFSFSSSIGVPFLTMLIGWAVLYGVLFIMGMILGNGKVKAKGLFSVIAVASVPWTIALLILSLLVLIFGGIKGFTFFVMVILLIAVNVISLEVLSIGLKKIIPSDIGRTLALSIGAALQFVIGIRFMLSSITELISSLLFGSFF